MELELSATELSLHREGWSASFSFKVPCGSWASLLGGSGAGKTTLLELVAGFENPSSGTLEFCGHSLLGLPTHKRNLAYVFQQNALFPHLSAFENLRVALHDAGITERDKEKRIVKMAARVGMESRLRHMPSQLSGGELARMNLARALLRPSKLLLLDEPFASLDASLRREMHGLVRELHAENNLTTLCVTHHPEDAFLFADTILVFSEGKIVAQGTPAELISKPESEEVARVLDAGHIVQSREGVFYVRYSQLTCSLRERMNFAASGEIHLQQWKFAKTANGTVVVCLNTGRQYLVDFPNEFSGTFYFDASAALSFHNRATV